ncbi:MAG: DNA (cytosine-5-)-methyltransferase [Christensenellaceae bacterium]|jgi:DNA (cytosine-5)-methyltransferase 1|nr:DNA (cytosine-5-)-methyltransferase [Christensenellaceae bacterium]
MFAKQKKRRLKVFEAFAGIGAQTTALERLGIDFEVVGISDWFVDAIICYDAIHHEESENIPIPSREEKLRVLGRYTFSRDSVNPIIDLSRMDEEKLSDLYRAHIRSRNFGSIKDLQGMDMPDTDLFVYSFPCQDLSTAGNNYGMKKNSGTRSSLLWEIERILMQLYKQDRLPQYLLLENVKTIKSKTNASDLNQWLSFLEKIGYQNEDCMLLNACDFGIPQDRERAFIFSHLGNVSYNIAERVELKKSRREYDIRDFIKTDYRNPTYRMEADIAQLNGTPSRQHMWEINGREVIDNQLIVRTITCNMDRTNTSALFRYDGPKGNTYRRLTIREAFLLMGFSEQEYQRTEYLNYSYRCMNKLIGNSIVVNVLEAIFSAIVEAEAEING